MGRSAALFQLPRRSFIPPTPVSASHPDSSVSVTLSHHLRLALLLFPQHFDASTTCQSAERQQENQNPLQSAAGGPVVVQDESQRR